MPMLAGQVDHVIGVDTHRDSNTAGVVDAVNGAVVAHLECTTDAMGYKRLFAFAGKHAAGRRVWAIEGTGSFGAGLTTFLLERGEWVVEIDRPSRPARRNGAKTDELDVVRAARDALSAVTLPHPGLAVTGNRCVSCWRPGRGRSWDAPKAISQLKPLIIGAPEGLRKQLRRGTTYGQLERSARLRTLPTHSVEHRATVRAIRSVARRALFLEAEASELETELEQLVVTASPQLLDRPG